MPSRHDPSRVMSHREMEEAVGEKIAAKVEMVIFDNKLWRPCDVGWEPYPESEVDDGGV